MGAWIETLSGKQDYKDQIESHPMWVRGLKLSWGKSETPVLKSHPMWVRGLKHGIEN